MPVEWYGDDVKAKVERATEKGLSVLAGKIADDARASMEYVGRGRDYSRGGKSKRFKHRSSAPYDPPSAQHGTQGTQGSIVWEKPNKLTRHIGWSKDNRAKNGYNIGFMLEIGTKNMAARPHLRPALYKHTGRTGDELWEGLLE